MSLEQIRIGIIGAGENTRSVHLPNLKAIPGVEVLQVANRTTASGQKVAEEFDIPEVKSTWQEVATAKEIDAVVIGTWPYLHCEATCLALESGKHVLCEARMAMNEAEAKKMLRVSLEHPECVAHLVPAPFSLHADQTIRQLINSGRLGNLLYFHADFQSSSLATDTSQLHWRRNVKFSGLNTMVLGIFYETVTRWLPPARWVSAVGRVFNDTATGSETGEPTRIEIADYLSVQMEMRNGMAGSFLISEAGVHADPPNIKIFGDYGTIKFDFRVDGNLYFASSDAEKLEPVNIPPEKQGKWRVEEEFINSIRGGERVKLNTFAIGVDYMKFTEAAIRSVQNSGRRMIL